MVCGLIGEVIFADGGSSDNTQEIAIETGATFLSTPKGRGAQQATAALAAKGRWLLFLHADSNLPEGWPAVIFEHLSKSDAAAFQLKFDAKGIPPRFTAWFANTRTRLLGLPYGDQGLLIPAKLYQRIGGHPNIPLMEDVAIARALKGRIELLPATLTTSAEKYQKNGWIRQGIRNLFTLLRYRLGTSPERLARSYYAGKE